MNEQKDLTQSINSTPIPTIVSPEALLYTSSNELSPLESMYKIDGDKIESTSSQIEAKQVVQPVSPSQSTSPLASMYAVNNNSVQQISKPDTYVNENVVKVPTQEYVVPTLPEEKIERVAPTKIVEAPVVAESKKCPMFTGKKYRITIMTDRLIRFEYNENGEFEDRSTQIAIFRDFNPIEVISKEDENFLEITTKYCKIFYTKEKHYDGGKFNPTANLRVVIPGEEEKTWYYGNPEVRNYLGSSSSLDELKPIANKGLYSVDGYATVDDSKGHIILETGELIERPKDIIDIYLFVYKSDYTLALKDYFTLTGIPPLLPRYALGNWWSKNYEYKDENVRYLINKFKRKDIPISVFLFDEAWHLKDKHDRIMYSWNNDNIPNPLDLTNFMHKKGIKVGLSINPQTGIVKDDMAYNTMAASLNITNNKDIPLDINSKLYVSSYVKNILKPLEDNGVDFFWNDYYDKKNTVDLALLQYYLYNFSDKLTTKRGLLMSRNGMVAPHRYSVLYSGRSKVDWEVLKFLPFYNAAASNIGVSWWSHDIGGYTGGSENKELYLRYVQLGVFSPIFRFSSDSSKYYKRMPWKWDYETSEIAKEYMQLSHKLIPYLYTEAYNYHKFGSPIIQPLYYTYPKIYDQPLYKNQYFFGTEMLIAPICETQNPVMNRVAHKFFLPNGIWYDFKTGKKFPGGKNYVSFYKLYDYPIFCKAGAIIPLANI